MARGAWRGARGEENASARSVTGEVKYVIGNR